MGLVGDLAATLPQLSHDHDNTHYSDNTDHDNNTDYSDNTDDDNTNDAGGSCRWPELRGLRQGEPVLPRWPAESLPGFVCAMAETSSAAVGAPPTLGYSNALGIISASMVGWIVDVQYGWDEPAPDYWACLARSGLGKSPQLKALRRAVDDAMRSLRPTTSPAGPPQDTAQFAAVESDLTPEGLVRALENNAGRVIVLDAEGSGVLDSTTGRRYKTSGDHTAGSMSVILKCWSGETIRQTRAKETRYVENPSVGIVLGLQPAVLDSMASDRDRSVGFFSRFLLTWATGTGGDLRHLPPIDAATDTRWRELVSGLVQCVQRTPGARLALTPDAVVEVLEHAQAWRELAAGEWEGFDDIIGKYRGHVVRVAAAIAVGDALDSWKPGTPFAMPRVVRSHVDRAAKIVDHALYSTRIALAHASDVAGPDVRHAEEILQWLNENGHEIIGPVITAIGTRDRYGHLDAFTQRDLFDRLRCRGWVTNVEAVAAPLRALEAAGWLRQLPPPPGAGRPPVVFERRPRASETRHGISHASPQYPQNPPAGPPDPPADPGIAGIAGLRMPSPARIPERPPPPGGPRTDPYTGDDLGPPPTDEDYARHAGPEKEDWL